MPVKEQNEIRITKLRRFIVVDETNIILDVMHGRTRPDGSLTSNVPMGAIDITDNPLPSEYEADIFTRQIKYSKKTKKYSRVS